MRQYLLVLCIFLSFQAQAEVGWISAGGSYSPISNMTADEAEKLKSANSWFVSLEMSPVLPLVGFHYGYRRHYANDVNFLINNQPQKADFRMANHEFGGKICIPLRKLDLFAGMGVISGSASVDDKVKSAYGNYWGGGIHVFFTKVLGIKFEYQKNSIRTNEYSTLNNHRLKFDQTLWTVGLVIRFGSDNFMDYVSGE